MKPFEIVRVFDAPRTRVWRAWTEAEQLRHWWGPAGFKVHTCKLDLRPGGVFLYGMTSPDGSEVWGRFVYREIEPPAKLAFIVSFSDPQGAVTRHPWSPDWPLHIGSTILFDDLGGRTRVTVQWLPHEATDIERSSFEKGRESMKQGWTGTLDQFNRYLETNA